MALSRFAAVKVAYQSIDLRYFPYHACVEILIDGTTSVLDAAELQDEEAVALLLWNAVVTAASDYG